MRIDARAMNAETISAFCYRYVFAAAIASICVAQILEKRLKGAIAADSSLSLEA